MTSYDMTAHFLSHGGSSWLSSIDGDVPKKNHPDIQILWGIPGSPMSGKRHGWCPGIFQVCEMGWTWMDDLVPGARMDIPWSKRVRTCGNRQGINHRG